MIKKFEKIFRMVFFSKCQKNEKIFGALKKKKKKKNIFNIICSPKTSFPKQ